MQDHFIVRARWIFLAVFVAICAWLIPGVQDLENDDDVLAFLPADHPDVQTFRTIADRYGMLELALIGLGADGEDIVTPAHMDEIRALTEKLSQVEGVNIVLSAADLPNPIVTEDGLVVAPLVPENLRDPEELRERVFASTDAVGNFVSADGKAAALIVFLSPREGDGPEAFAARRATLHELAERTRAGWSGEVHLTGAPFIEMAASESSRGDIERLSPLVIGVLALVSAVLLGSITAAFLNLLVTGIGVGLIVGAHGVFGEPFTIVSSATPVMMVALGGAFGVHVLAGYQRQSGSPQHRASATIRELWLPVVLSGCTTAVAFFALMVMPQVPMQRFGLVAGIGVILLLAMSLFVMPALLSVLPARLIATKRDRPVPLPFRPPMWLLVILAVLGVVLARGMKADPDTLNIFPPESEPRTSAAFFDEHFGGSTYLQVAVAGPLADNEILRVIRDVSDEVEAIEGVIDVRSVYDPVSTINAALGGRRGVPETEGRASRVLTYITGHPAMRQLMTEDGQAAVIHIKLAPMSGERQVQVADQVRAVLAAHQPASGELTVAATTNDALKKAQREEVLAHVSTLLGKKIDPEALGKSKARSPAFLAEIAKLRDQALDSEEGAVAAEIPAEEIAGLSPDSLVEPRGEALEALLREKLPTLVAQDPEGVGFAAEHLGAWIDEAAGKYKADALCGPLELDEAQCDRFRPLLTELDDEQWAVPAGVDAGEAIRKVPLDLSLTGQPVIGQAFAESVVTSLWQSTLVSIGALAVVLLVSRFVFALVPAVWTLAFAAGVIALLGHTISVSTSMVSCIALGAGVDFAIHLGFRARQHRGVDAGLRAVQELGAVVLISAAQLAMAFAVLMGSELLALREFGVGLAVGLVGAALGAVWFTPKLAPGKRGD